MTKLAKEAAKSWSSTLRLPKSTFPARPSPADLQAYLKRATDDLYQWQTQARAKQRPFVIHDGPPYANGDLHVGHALNKILKDIINRTQLLKGRRVSYVPGWDCHGLPIEQKALEHHGWSVGDKPGAVEVRQAAAHFANDAVQKQMADFRSWAVMGDWIDYWKTMDPSFELRQLQVFRNMANAGLVYRRHKPVYWSPSSRTALAEAELEYKDDHISRAVLVKFPLDSASSFCKDEQVSLLIWTTTPWTLPANQAIAINRALEYVIAHSGVHGKLLLARSRLQAVEVMLGQELPIWKSGVDVDDLLQSSYIGLDSFDDKSKRPIFHASFVSADAGTGLVHCAPGHGMEDYEALQLQISSGLVQVKAPVDDAGNFTVEACPANPELLVGKSVFGEGNTTIIATLQRAGSLLAVQDYKHKYPYDWRTKQPVLIRATAQWFANLSNIKSDALNALDTVEFHPETSQSRLRSFVDSRSEWCISRQRSWGVPIPALYHKGTGEAILTDTSVKHIIDCIAARGIDAWWSDSADDAAWVEPGLEASQYLRGTDTMDVWFDSGTSWSMLNSKHPLTPEPVEWNQVADVYLEGTDQHRGWFQSSLLLSVAAQKARYWKLMLKPRAPFKKLLTHGFTLDAAGKKMSKSVGNVISPGQIITGKFELPGNTVSGETGPLTGKVPKTSRAFRKQGHATGSLGPDALRLWAASSDWSKDVVVSETVVKTVHASLHKYRVTFKLLLGALEGFEAHHSRPKYSDMLADGLALLQLFHVCTDVRNAFDNFEFHKAVALINRWINTEVSAFYVEAIKDTIYCDDSFNHDNGRRLNAQTTLFQILTQMQAMLRPLTPLLVEESWEHSSESLRIWAKDQSHTIWHAIPSLWYHEYLDKTISPLVMAISSACKLAQERARIDKKMASGLECNVFVHMPGLDGIIDHLYENGSSLSVQRRALIQGLEEILVVSSLILKDLGPDFVPTTAEEFWTSDDESPAEQHSRKLGLEAIQQWSYIEQFTMPDGVTKGHVMVHAPTSAKCARCWKYQVIAEVPDTQGENQGSQEQHEELCKRCRSVVSVLESTEHIASTGTES
jgi:isoleucyl-tRNA synthetase